MIIRNIKCFGFALGFLSFSFLIFNTYCTQHLIGAGIIVVEEVKIYSARIIRKSKYKTFGCNGDDNTLFFSVHRLFTSFYQFRETSSLLLDVIEGRCIIRKSVGEKTANRRDFFFSIQKLHNLDTNWFDAIFESPAPPDEEGQIRGFPWRPYVLSVVIV